MWVCGDCICLPVPVCRSRRIDVQCFYTGSEHPALPVCPAAAPPRPAGSKVVCHTPEEDCGYMAASLKQGWPAHTAGGGPASRCPWPVGSGPGCTEDLRQRSYIQLQDNKIVL